MWGLRGLRSRVAQGQVGKSLKFIQRDDFILQLKDSWYPYVGKTSDIEVEVVKARERIEKSGVFKATFDRIGLTGGDLRGILQDIIDEKPATETRIRVVGRNTSCPCGSGLKYKRCCGLKEA